MRRARKASPTCPSPRGCVPTALRGSPRRAGLDGRGRPRKDRSGPAAAASVGGMLLALLVAVWWVGAALPPPAQARAAQSCGSRGSTTVVHTPSLRIYSKRGVKVACHKRSGRRSADWRSASYIPATAQRMRSSVKRAEPRAGVRSRRQRAVRLPPEPSDRSRLHPPRSAAPFFRCSVRGRRAGHCLPLPRGV